MQTYVPIYENMEHFSIRLFPIILLAYTTCAGKYFIRSITILLQVYLLIKSVGNMGDVKTILH